MGGIISDLEPKNGRIFGRGLLTILAEKFKKTQKKTQKKPHFVRFKFRARITNISKFFKYFF